MLKGSFCLYLFTICNDVQATLFTICLQRMEHLRIFDTRNKAKEPSRCILTISDFAYVSILYTNERDIFTWSLNCGWSTDDTIMRHWYLTNAMQTVYDFIGQCIAHWTDCNSVLKWFCCVILLKIGNYNTPIVRYTLTGTTLLVWRVWSGYRWIDTVIELLKTVCYSKITMKW